MAVDKNVVEDFHGMDSNLMEENFTEASYEIELPVPEETTEIPIDVMHEHTDFSADSDSDNDAEVSSSDSSEEIDDSDTNSDSLDSPDESESNVSKGKTFSAQENACMAILALISRHCMTTEAAKDILDLLKLICPENVTVQTLILQVYNKCVETVRFLFMTSVKDVLPFFLRTERIKSFVQQWAVMGMSLNLHVQLY